MDFHFLFKAGMCTSGEEEKLNISLSSKMLKVRRVFLTPYRSRIPVTISSSILPLHLHSGLNESVCSYLKRALDLSSQCHFC